MVCGFSGFVFCLVFFFSVRVNSSNQVVCLYILDFFFWRGSGLGCIVYIVFI